MQEYENAFILVSHDMEFLNAVINIIYHVNDGQLTRYTGNYEKLEELKKALKEFKGTILLVCHEPEFYKDWITDVWNVESWTLKVV